MSAALRPARMLVRAGRHGVLSTHSVRFAGFPFGSAVPYAVDPAGCPLLLMSDLAAHTRNLGADPRASLCVHQQDVVGGARVTLVGTLTRCDEDTAARERFLTILPEARQYAGFGDFHLYRLEPVGGHFVAGFARVHWFSGGEYLVKRSALNEREREVVQHLNRDHAALLRDLCRHYQGVTSERVELLDIDCDGFDVRAGDRLLRLEFEAPAADPGQARVQLMAMAQRARGGERPD